MLYCEFPKGFKPSCAKYGLMFCVLEANCGWRSFNVFHIESIGRVEAINGSPSATVQKLSLTTGPFTKDVLPGTLGRLEEPWYLSKLDFF